MINKKTKKQKQLKQTDRVLNFLISKGKKGATNFEMMMALKICDVRKRISDLNNMLGLEYSIESEYVQSQNNVKFKRYWAVPLKYNGDLRRFLDEGQHFSTAGRKRTGGGRR